MDIVSDITYNQQSVITCVVKWFLWHNAIHWITVTPYDKSVYVCYCEILFNFGTLVEYAVQE